MFSVVFVCAGNTCRSPMAAAVARRLAGDAQVEIRFESAGIAAMDGQSASNHAAFVVHDRGGDLTPHRSRFLDDSIVEGADLLLTMTRSQRDELRRRYPRHGASIHTLGEMAGVGSDIDVDDPIGGDLTRYEETYDQIERYLQTAMDEIVRRAHAQRGATP